MKIIIPMAGRGRRFAATGFNVPKPLISVLDKPMIYWALKSIDKISHSELIFIALKKDEERFNVSKVLRDYFGNDINIVIIDNVTEGQLCTVLKAKELINTHEDILILSADTYVKSNIGSDIESKPRDCYGIISVTNMPGSRWSFVKTDDKGIVTEVAEKKRISDCVSTGIYYFSDGKLFVSEAEQMIINQEKTKGEYYIIPLYQKYVEKGRKVLISIAEHMIDMGTPESLLYAREKLKNVCKRDNTVNDSSLNRFQNIRGRYI